MTDSAFTQRQLNFEKWRQMNGLTFVQIADASGVPYSTLKSFTTKPGQGMIDRNIEKLTLAYRISADDIFVEPRLIRDTPLTPLTAQSQTPAVTTPDGLVRIPAYDIRLAAGGGTVIDREEVKEHWAVPLRFITDELGLSPSTLSMAEVTGDSMYPLLWHRDRILINHADINPSPPGVFALWDGYGLVVKKVQRIHRSDPEKAMLISENPTYPPYEVFLDEINIIGRVVWFNRRM
ncbi:helix-turn-helix transcriptional regulator [Asticcacaulis sp. 201]|uniref:S24 family peptidase n=1 Tax=Asticcacaulis sp. 201 TaxID=3028787 RepID=UPI0029170160|nr:S24 family peptidase [Asticcacaulis sp. 201]MDV6330013.1 S24 family peptidase [Asticcacaulis sp. 201]